MSIDKRSFIRKMLFEKVNSTLAWILLIPYIILLPMDFTDSMIKIYTRLDSSG